MVSFSWRPPSGRYGEAHHGLTAVDRQAASVAIERPTRASSFAGRISFNPTAVPSLSHSPHILESSTWGDRENTFKRNLEGGILVFNWGCSWPRRLQ
jgi:hypothetical protein